jgi:hypothetical protein
MEPGHAHVKRVRNWVRHVRAASRVCRNQIRECKDVLSSTTSTTELFPPQHGSLHINYLLLSFHWKDQSGCNKWRLQRRNLLACSNAFKSPYHAFSPLYRFFTRPGSPIGFRSEGSPMAEDPAPLWTSEELTDRRTSFAQRPAMTTDLLDAM